MVALLNTNEDTIAYHREVLATQLQIWDWQSGERITAADVFMRNLDGVLPADDGGYLTTSDFSNGAGGAADWWTSSYNFDGILRTEDGVTFKPQVLGMTTGNDCYYCGTCSLNPRDMQISCRNTYFSQENRPWSVLANAGQLTLHAENNAGDDIDLKLPADYQPEWDLRLLGFSEEYQTAFYCLDAQGRSRICAIDMNGEKEQYTEVEDIYGLRFSADGSRAAYIDRREKALFLLNLETGKLSKMDAYQSRAWFVNPAFASVNVSEESETELDAELVYVIQNLNDESILSLEWVDATDAKVLRRSTLDAAIGRPAALSLGAENGLVALGSEDGAIYLLDQEKGRQLAFWQANTNKIVGLAFAEGDDLLISMDDQGTIRIWGVE